MIGKTGLTHVVINIVDKDGNIVYDAANEATINITGNASLLGMESGSDNSHEDYKSNKRKALHGKLIGYVWKDTTTKSAEINIESAGLTGATLLLN